MGFYARIRSTYGDETYSNLSTWTKNNTKLASLRNRRVFLLQCKSCGVKPNHIVDRVKCIFSNIRSRQSGEEVLNFNKKVIHRLLLLEIKITVKEIVKLERETVALWHRLEESLPRYILTEYKCRQLIRYNRIFAQIKNKNSRKLKNLQQKQTSHIKSQNRWIKNVSSTDIPNDIKSFLALGPKFSIEIPKKEVSIPNLLADVDLIIESNFNEDQKNIIRAKTTNTITNYLIKTPKITNVTQVMFYKCKKYLKENPELLILQSDKGNVTVAIDKSTYNNLAIELLNDKKYYKVLNRDPTLTIQGKSNELVKNLEKKGYINKEVAKKLFNYNSISAKFYGLPKIHKPTLSLRPIVSSINTPTSKLSIFIAEILSQSFNNETDKYYVKDSFHFSQLMNNFQLPNDYVIVSLDVVSLYSNIPLDLVIKIIETKWDTISPYTNIPKEEFVILVRFIFNSSFFTYNETFYSQIFGCPMGSNLSPVVARLTMDYTLDQILEKLPFEMPFIKKYVDDIICAIPKDKIDTTLQQFNQHNEHIQFTIEKEVDNCVPFLDTKLIRTDNNKIILDWYKKPMCSNRYINFFSNHPNKQKINLVLGLKNRIEKISHPTLLQKNLTNLFNILKENSYPPQLLNRLIFNSRNDRFSHRQNPEQMTNRQNILENRKFHSLPIISDLTEELINILKHDNLKIAKKNTFMTRQLFSSTKDKTPKEKKTDVVYMVPCSSCNLVYVGQTTQQLKKRLIQHKSDIKNPSKKCALAEHCRKTQHVMNFGESKVLELEKTARKRNFLEMYHIKRNKNSMNSKSDIQNISNIYSYLIQFQHDITEHNVNN